MITVIDYGLGNLASVANALRKLGITSKVSSNIDVLKKAKAFILPGVGAAGEGMKNLKKRKLDTLILDQVKNGKPILGICLGMQLFMSFSEEGNVDCLNLIEGTVKKFNTKLKIPQIGWNNVRIMNHELGIMNNIPNNSYFYFVNSYYCSPPDQSLVAASTEYGKEFTSVIVKNNIIGMQFHPEKSGDVGLQLLKNFWEAVC